MTATPEFSLDWPHGHTTRDGRPARIICRDAKGLYPVVVLAAGVNDPTGECVRRYHADGRVGESYGGKVHDLINAPAPRRTVWRVSAYFATYDEGKRLFDHTMNTMLPFEVENIETEFPPRWTGLTGGGE